MWFMLAVKAVYQQMPNVMFYNTVSVIFIVNPFKEW